MVAFVNLYIKENGGGGGVSFWDFVLHTPYRGSAPYPARGLPPQTPYIFHSSSEFLKKNTVLFPAFSA